MLVANRFKPQHDDITGAAAQKWLRQAGSRLQDTSLTDDERQALAEFVTTILRQNPDLIDDIILYGSAARGELRSESDVDLLLLARYELTQAEEEPIRQAAFEAALNYNCILSPLVMTPTTQQWHRRGSSLWRNIQRDGIPLLGARDSLQFDTSFIFQRKYLSPGVSMLTEAQYEEIRLFMERSRDDLESADMELRSNKERAAISLCYYAVFYAISALLLTKRITRAKHSGVRSVFHEQFIKTGIFPNDMGDLFTKLQNEREKVDYDMRYELGEEVAEQRLQQSITFVDSVRYYLVQNNYTAVGQDL